MSGMFETIASGVGFVDGLRWHEGRLWFSDFNSRRVMSMSRDGDLKQELYVPGQPNGLGFTPEGAMLIVSMHDGHILQVERGSKFILADIGAIHRGALGDLLTLPDGRSYLSVAPAPVIGEPAPPVPADGGQAPLLLISPNGETRVVADGLKFPNGMAVSADGGTLFVAETLGYRISAFSIAADGTLGEARVHAELEKMQMPDAVAIDSKDRLWVACTYTSEYIRLLPDGTVDIAVKVPDGLWTIGCAVSSDDELWCSVAETSVENYLDGRAKGYIMRWRA